MASTKGTGDDAEQAAVRHGEFVVLYSLIRQQLAAVRMEQWTGMVPGLQQAATAAQMDDQAQEAWLKLMEQYFKDQALQPAAMALIDPQAWAAVSAGLQAELELDSRLDRKRRRPGGWLFGWIFPSLRERVQAWEALFERVSASVPTPVDEEVHQLSREYEYLRAWEWGMVGKLSLYQLGFALVLSGIWVGLALYRPDPWALEKSVPYLTSAYWGAIGAITSSFWMLLRHSAGRTLRMDQFLSHLLKPIVGGFLGVAIYLLVPSGFISVKAGDTGLTLTSLWAIALVAGLYEATVMRKLQEVADTIFGVNPVTAAAAAKKQ